MTKVWNIISFLAVMNLIAVGCFVVWLFGSGRMDADRLERTRLIYDLPIEQETAERVAAEKIEALEAALQQAADAAAASKEAGDRALKQRLVAIEAKHQQGSAALKAEVSELSRSLQTERMALQAAQQLNEKLFNEMNPVV